ncbi:MAG TPA: hypothetical protein DGG95_14370 [Cytophagales bacterium]|nr:hypothetical protein [Cytophagales bacterium]
MVLCFGLVRAQGDCKETKATIEVLQASQNDDKALVKINFHDQNSLSFQVSLVGPKGFFKDNIQEKEIKGLKEGTYTLVLTPIHEKDNFCMKHFEFTIKN